MLDRARVLTLSAVLFSCGDDGHQPPECPGGFSGPDCTFCTWTSAGEACQPVSPRDLFDITAIQALSLADLEWAPMPPQQFNGVTVLGGTYNAGTWNAYTSAGVERTIDLHYAVAIYVPPNWPQPGDPPYAYVSSVHMVGNLLQAIGPKLATYFRIPIVHVAQLREDWEDLMFTDRAALNTASTSSVIEHNECSVIDVARGQFSVAMALADMRAITLVQRLATQAGGRVDSVAFRGFSKEGMAGWLLSAVDPRVTVAGLGGFQREDTLQADALEIARWGCWGNPMTADTAGPQTAGRVMDWRLNTPAGAAWMNAFDVQHNKSLLTPRFLLLDGDVGMAGMHDGSYYAIGDETPFLDDLTEIPWRYVRKPTVTVGATDPDGDVTSKAIVPGLLVENLIGGAGSETTTYPKVNTATATINGNLLDVTATASAPTTEMSLWWSSSTDGVWNDAGQTAWTSVTMTQNAGTWTAPPVDVSTGTVIGWYVEARNTLTIGADTYTRADAAPVRFLRETPAITCTTVIPDWCADVAH